MFSEPLTSNWYATPQPEECVVETFDVVVLGTGAAALTAAIRAADEGASVGLFEKADSVGGTSAWSGGMVWIPMNPHMAELGIDDTREEVMTYLGSLSNGLIDETLAGAMIDAGPEVISYLEENTPTRFQIIKDFPDYHPEHPGAKSGGGRSLECPLSRSTSSVSGSRASPSARSCPATS